MIEISYSPPPLAPGGTGQVYVVSDGLAHKIGHTRTHLAVRIAGLQTGNPRTIRAVASISPASEAVEAHLHTVLAPWYVQGEWFRKQDIDLGVANAGGWSQFLRNYLPHGDWAIQLHE
jgi:hypothetical protein